MQDIKKSEERGKVQSVNKRNINLLPVDKVTNKLFTGL